MDDRTARLESAVDELKEAVRALRQRVDVLERSVSRSPAPGSPTDAPTAAGGAADLQARSSRRRSKDPYDPIAMLSLVGRLLIVLAGGFLLRAITEAGYLADPAGIALAFLYAIVWLFMSERAGARGQVPSAVFHALAAAMVAYPLAVEATTRFKVLSATAAAPVLALLSLGLLAIGWRRQLRALPWIAVLGGVPASAVLLVQTGTVVPFALVLIVLGVATLWLSYASGWWGARWPAALAADAAVAGVTVRAFATERRDAPEVAMGLLLVLLIGYLGSIAWRTLAQRREVSRFEMVQTAVALAVGIGGGVVMARATGGVPALVGIAAIGVGAACYGLAMTVIARREAAALNFYFYTTLALVLVLTGFVITVDDRWAGALYGLFALLAAGLWARSGQLFALLHGAAYVLAAGIVSGAFRYGVTALVTGVEGGWSTPGTLAAGVALASALTAVLAATRPAAEGSEVTIAARLLVAVAATWLVCATVVGYLAPIAGTLTGGVSTGLLATVRTGVLSVTTLVIAAMARQDRYREWGWLVYPLLIGIGLKLLTQDFKHSRPATLFIALAFYGAALIIAPRLRKRIEGSAQAAEAN